MTVLHLHLPAEAAAAAIERDAASRAESILTAVESALATDRARVADLLASAEQARRLGVSFDPGEAIRCGLTADDARAAVLAIAKPRKRRRRRGRVDNPDPRPADYAALPSVPSQPFGS